MKRIYTVLSVFFLLFAMLMGLLSTFDKDVTYSEAEKRKLKTKPKMTVSSLIDGTYFNENRAYYPDTFPNRETLMKSNTTLNGFYYFGGFGSDDSASLVVDLNLNAAQHGEALKPTGDSDAPTGEAQNETEPEHKPSEPLAAAEQLGSVVLIGDSAFDVPHADNDQIVKYAQAVTAIADLLGSDVKTFSMPVPNSAEFYTHKEYHTGKTSQKAMFDLLKSNIGANVSFIDAYSAIEKHTDEYIYFRTDHHWTHLGAYYAYTALCESAGFTPVNRDDFATGQWEGFVGSLYTVVANYPQGQVLKDNPDTVHYWKPSANITTTCYKSTALTNGYAMGTICRVGEEVENKYLTFMGGDHPVAVVQTDTEGPTILVIKESYGNALISWLTNHYNKIILIDPRQYFNNAKNADIDLAAFAAEQGVDQCLIVNYPMMLNSDGYTGLLEKLVK